MKLQQLRCIFEVVQNDFNISKAANSLHTSQPGVSKQIQLLEYEVGVQIFQRNGKRLTGLTEPGQQVFDSILEIIREEKNIKRVSEEYEKKIQGILQLQQRTLKPDINYPMWLKNLSKNIQKST